MIFPFLGWSLSIGRTLVSVVRTLLLIDRGTSAGAGNRAGHMFFIKPSTQSSHAGTTLLHPRWIASLSSFVRFARAPVTVPPTSGGADPRCVPAQDNNS